MSILNSGNTPLESDDMVSIISDMIDDMNSEKVDELLDDETELKSLLHQKQKERQQKSSKGDVFPIEPISFQISSVEPKALFAATDLKKKGQNFDQKHAKQEKKLSPLKRIYRKADYFVDKHFFPELLELDYGVKVEKKEKKPKTQPSQLIKQLYYKLDYKIDEKFFPKLLEIDYKKPPKERDDQYSEEAIYDNLSHITESVPVVIVTQTSGEDSVKGKGDEEGGVEGNKHSDTPESISDAVKRTQRERMRRIIEQRKDSGRPRPAENVMRILLG